MEMTKGWGEKRQRVRGKESITGVERGLLQDLNVADNSRGLVDMLGTRLEEKSGEESKILSDLEN